MDEQQLVKLYMELTGTPEQTARNVFMMVCCPNQHHEERPTAMPDHRLSNGENKPNPPAMRRPFPGAALFVGLLMFCWPPVPVHAVESFAGPQAPQPFGSPLSLADAINLALHQSPSVLRAQKALEASQGIVIQTRAIALPGVTLNGSYGRVQRTDVDVVEAPGITFGTPQNWSSQVKLIQSLYQGGRILSGLRAAQLTKQQAVLSYQTALSDTVLAVQLAYYDVLLAAQQIIVQEASVALLTNELTDTTRRFDAGTVPRFNVLRAEVELANARPKLITARNSLRISKNNLANVLGLNVPPGTFEDIPLKLSGRLEAEAFELELPRAIELALEQRTELGVLRKAEALRKEDVIVARAGYKPVLQGYVGYDLHNSILNSDLTTTDYGWIAGAQLSWNLFDGLRTQGRVKEAAANYERAGIDVDDKRRSIELEVRTAYSNFIEAREVLESQKKVVEEAEEALRLARARSEAGTGTQLDVLSAQTALTEARTTQVQALHDYETARARLQRTIGMNVPGEMAK
ncbi:MAG TPA: TolC family protein [Verrucomicrobiae bacterium]|nr:TolC family protein [Verrucomicrobiae bacterium]